MSENITTIEVGHLALFKFQEIKDEINSIFEKAYKIFYCVPCYKTFSLLRMNIDKQPEEIKNKYTQYTKKPNKFGIKVYNIHQHTHYIFTDLENHNICLFDDQIELQQNLENYDYRINTPTLDKYEIDIYDTCFDILAGDVATEALMQKLEDCLTYTNDLKYTYFPIPPNQEQWPCVISSLVNVLKKEQDFSTSLEKLLCNMLFLPLLHVTTFFQLRFWVLC